MSWVSIRRPMLLVKPYFHIVIYHNPYLCHVYHPFLKYPILWYIAIHFQTILYYHLGSGILFPTPCLRFLECIVRVSFIEDFKNLGHTKLLTARMTRLGPVSAQTMGGQTNIPPWWLFNVSCRVRTPTTCKTPKYSTFSSQHHLHCLAGLLWFSLEMNWKQDGEYILRSFANYPMNYPWETHSKSENPSHMALSR